jgi:hypothetical protein
MRELTKGRENEQFEQSPKSLFLFSATGRLRQRLRQLIHHRHFDNSILVCIIASSISLAVRDPSQEQDPPLIFFSDIAFSILFAMEMLLKVVTFGFVHSQHAYLRNSWNILDFLLVLEPAITYFTPSIRSLRTLRTFRALRPLRLISRNQGLQLAVNCLLHSLRGCLTTLLLGVGLFLLFAIPGHELFGGMMHRCMVSDGASEATLPVDVNSTVQDWLDCTGGVNGTWVGEPSNFDNVLKYVRTTLPDHSRKRDVSRFARLDLLLLRAGVCCVCLRGVCEK